MECSSLTCQLPPTLPRLALCVVQSLTKTLFLRLETRKTVLFLTSFWSRQDKSFFFQTQHVEINLSQHRNWSDIRAFPCLKQRQGSLSSARRKGFHSNSLSFSSSLSSSSAEKKKDYSFCRKKDRVRMRFSLSGALSSHIICLPSDTHGLLWPD